MSEIDPIQTAFRAWLDEPLKAPDGTISLSAVFAAGWRAGQARALITASPTWATPPTRQVAGRQHVLVRVAGWVKGDDNPRDAVALVRALAVDLERANWTHVQASIQSGDSWPLEVLP